MKNPTKDQVQVVIDTFQKAKDAAKKAKKKARVAMTQGQIFAYGKEMCQGAYYAKAKGMKRPADFISGGDAMAKDLGLSDIDQLKYWTDKKRDIWGNKSGFSMFTSSWAFSEDDNFKSVEDLQQIIDHWKGVQERLPV